MIYAPYFRYLLNFHINSYYSVLVKDKEIILTGYSKDISISEVLKTHPELNKRKIPIRVFKKTNNYYFYTYLDVDPTISRATPRKETKVKITIIIDYTL